MAVSDLLLGAGAVLIAHVALSTFQYMSIFSAQFGASAVELPLDIYAECALSLLLIVIGIFLKSDSLMPLHSSGEVSMNVIHGLFKSRPDLHSFAPVARLTSGSTNTLAAADE